MNTDPCGSGFTTLVSYLETGFVPVTIFLGSTRWRKLEFGIVPSSQLRYLPRSIQVDKKILVDLEQSLKNRTGTVPKLNGIKLCYLGVLGVEGLERCARVVNEVVHDLCQVGRHQAVVRDRRNLEGRDVVQIPL
jgi:hypothetical protein